MPLIAAAALVLPALLAPAAWLALEGRTRDPLVRAGWAAGAAAAGLAAVLAVAAMAGGRAQRRLAVAEREAGDLQEEDTERAAATESLEEFLPPVDLAGLSRVAHAIASETPATRSPALKRFLQFARPERPRRRRTDLNGAVEVCVAALAVSPGSPAARLSFDPDPKVGLVPVDPDALHRVVVNLVRNAREAAGDGGSVEVRTQLLGDDVLVAVRDDGPGVPHEALERIFHPFYTTRKGAMGLGLAICRQIAEAHGGTIGAVNVLPRGLEVGLRLPLSRMPLLSGGPAAGSVRPTS